MASVGLVLGGGGITGAAYELAALMSLQLATGWNPNRSDVVVGTSAGSFIAALVRHDRLGLDFLVRANDTREAVAERLASRLFDRRPGLDVTGWLRHGLLPGMRRPGLTLLLGSPAPWSAAGLRSWVEDEIGAGAHAWPARPTVVTAFDLGTKRRVAFGTTQAPEVAIADAVAASSAIPLLFRPWQIDGRPYVDGGVVSGTHADLVLGNPAPLDIVVVLAPMAADEERNGAWFHERLFDRVGRSALQEEVLRIMEAWPQCDVLVLRPSQHVLAAMRPNPMDANAAVPTFIRTLVSMRRTLAQHEVWSVLERHFVQPRNNRQKKVAPGIAAGS